jgi:hypothetical protein
MTVSRFSQDGAQKFGINEVEGVWDVRWGYSWNNNADFTSNDVIGGIGLALRDTAGRDGADGESFPLSAGDLYTCCGTLSPGGNRGLSVQMFGRQRPA